MPVINGRYVAPVDIYDPSEAQRGTGKSSLGKDDFLKLLVVQLQNQDPSQPMDDKEFIAQMASFSSLEQMKNVSSAMEATQATAMIGKTITWQRKDGTVGEGVVDSVKIADGESKLVVWLDKDNAEEISLKDVKTITNTRYVTE
ncbi:MAG: flagellar hook assembly protein FlgD [Negativicutes bacterium]|nr:flagellar hook assembly protein FlgD [Negativicutes bacterium]